MTNGDYCALSSHVGGGFSFFRDHRFNGVLKRGLQQAQDDFSGRFVYLKDEETGEVWTANVHPLKKYDTFEARQGIGYTLIKSSYSGISADLRYFVGPGIDAELWTVRLENRSAKARKLSVYSLAEFSLGNVSLYEGDVNFHGLFNGLRQTSRLRRRAQLVVSGIRLDGSRPALGAPGFSDHDDRSRTDSARIEPPFLALSAALAIPWESRVTIYQKDRPVARSWPAFASGGFNSRPANRGR